MKAVKHFRCKKVAFVTIGVLLVAATLFALYLRWCVVPRDEIALLARGYVSVTYRNGRADYSIVPTMPKAWTRLEAIPEKTRMAILMAEDARFYRHSGFDSLEIKKALEEAVREHKRPRGASTISQQVAKNLFLSNEYSVWRKVKELAIAIRLEHELSKDKILEVYLNTIEYGEGVYGISAACEYYFAKEPAQLSPKEAAFLGALLPNPKRYAQDLRSTGLTAQTRERMTRILETMRDHAYLSDEEFKRQKDAPLTFSQEALAAR